MITVLLAIACLPVDGPKLLARHFASAISEFAQLDGEAEIGLSPLPGVVRVMRGEEVRRIALKHGISAVGPADGLCFEWRLRPLDAEQVSEFMQKILPAGARVQILELSRSPVPEGTLEFALDKLQGNLWRGAVRYGSSGRFEIWARVRVALKQTRVVTSKPLRTGDTISASDLQLEEFEDAPLAGLVTSLEAAAGMLSKRVLPAGTHLKSEFLDQPKAVAKGDTVRLRATVGVAHVVTEASAQEPGKVGDVIPVKNMTSGRILRARVEGPGEVRLAQ